MSNQDWFEKGLNILIERDHDLAAITNRYGRPSQWQREPGFSTLIRIILEQQVSLSSAKKTFERLCKAITPLTPENFLKLDDIELKAIGFSKQKTRYGRELSQAIIKGKLDINALEKLDDLKVRKELTEIKGIGDWTTDMYLMMALQRSDIFPSKDLAVVTAVKEIKNLDHKLTLKQLESIAQLWQPYRTIATMILWHYYLNRKKSK
jgi:DNA-3-methyladenine glycosylase II